MRSLHRYRTLPEILNQPTLVNARRGPWSIILPVARTNLIAEPSFETALVDWSAISGSTLTRVTTQQYHGTYSLQITPSATASSGVQYTIPTALVNGTIYAYSLKFLGVAGFQYTLGFETVVNVGLASRTFTATGNWQWVWMFYTSDASLQRVIVVRRGSNTTVAPFYIDGVQVEVCASGQVFPTTFIDGDQRSLIEQFPPAYGWNGTRHASTSYRTAQTRDGGRVVNLDSYGYQVTATEGLGLVAPTHTVAVIATIDGAQYQSSVIPPRTIQIAGRLSATTRTLLQRNYAALGAALSLDTTFPRQPLALLYQPYRCDTPIGETAKIIASYIDGLNLDMLEHTQRDTKLRFAQWSPALVGRDQGAALDPQDTTSNANAILQRSSAGVWGALGTGISGTNVRALAYDLVGVLYAGGVYTSMNGVANTAGIASWDGTIWSAMGSGPAGGGVYAIVVGSDGKVYAAGAFTSMGGVANTAKIAYWDGSWHAMGTGATGGDVLALAIGPDGSVYAGGDYTLMGGVANTVRIAKWNGSAWSALSTGISGGISPEVDALAIGLDTKLYAAGKFTTAGATSAASIASWDGSAWAALSSGLNNSGLALAVGPDGRLYVGGNFTTAGGLSTNFIASWNGSSWFTLAQGFSSGTAVRSLRFGADGLLYIGGSFAVSAIPIIESLCAYNGTSFIPADVDLPSTATVLALALALDGRLTLGYDTTGSATVPGFTTLINSAVDALAYPMIRLTGQGAASTALYQIRNWTTNQILSFNLTILAQEQLTIRCGPGRVTITSNVRGDITPLLLPGSAAELGLLPGANSLALFAGSTAITAIASWAIRYATAAAVEF